MRGVAVWIRSLVALVGIAGLAACHDSSEPLYTNLRIYWDPYAEVDWDADVRLLAQHHDHVAGRPTRIQAYDAAGYDVLSLMDYSGNSTLSYSLKQRMWPPEQWVPDWVLDGMTSVKVLIPNAEEIGIEQHATSPFLTTYVQGATRFDGVLQSNEYSTIPSLFDLVRDLGGFPCIAHPWSYDYSRVSGVFCAEIYTAYAEAQKRIGRDGFVTPDRNVSMLENWDRALEANQKIVGIAVNDHYGPYAHPSDVAADIRDSGKIEVFAKAATAEAYRDAFERGAVFAIRDRGIVKGQYPTITRVEVDAAGADISADGRVRWLSRGRVIGDLALLTNSDLPANTRYVRAEVVGDDGSTVYTQAFAVRPVGDSDGDYDIDDSDAALCRLVDEGVDTEVTHVLACEARD